MRLSFLTVIAALGLGAGLQAATFDYSFTAMQTDMFLTDGSNSVAREAAGLDTITGTITLSDDVIFRHPSSQVIHFAAPTILIDGLDLTDVIQPFSTRVENNNPETEDSIGLDAVAFEPLQSAISAFFVFGEAFDDLRFPEPDVFQGFLNRSAGGASLVALEVVSNGPDFGSRAEFASFRLTSMTPNFATDPAPVPLPASALMLLAAIAGVGAMRGRRTA